MAEEIPAEKKPSGENTGEEKDLAEKRPSEEKTGVEKT